MAISVEDVQTGVEGNGNDIAVTFTALEDDRVIVVGGNSGDPLSTTAAPGITEAGWNELITPVADDDVGLGAWEKLMGSTPDTGFTGEGNGDNQTGTGYIALVLRGVDASTVLDVSVVSTGLVVSDGSDVDCDSVTSVTDGALIIAAAALGDDPDEPSALTGYSNFTVVSRNETHDYTVSLGTLAQVSAGAENPPAFTSWAPSIGSWIGFTIAIRPAGAAADASMPLPTRERALIQALHH